MIFLLYIKKKSTKKYHRKSPSSPFHFCFTIQHDNDHDPKATRKNNVEKHQLFIQSIFNELRMSLRSNYRLTLLINCSVTLLRTQRCTFLFTGLEIRSSYWQWQNAPLLLRFQCQYSAKIFGSSSFQDTEARS